MPHTRAPSTVRDKPTRANSPAISETVSFEDLKSLAQAQGPCITVAVAIPDPAQRQAHLKNAIRDVENGLISRGMDARSATTLVEPLRVFTAQIAAEGDWGIQLVLFKSRDTTRCFQVRDLSKDFVTIGDRFQIRPLLPLMSRDQQFYLLALSQKHVRLLLCTWRTAKEIPLRALVPQNLKSWLNSRMPDHVLDNRVSAGPSVGAMKGVMFGTSTDSDRHDEYLAHFFKEIDKGLYKVLVSQNLSLQLAGVESEIALYRKVNSYPHLLEPAVQGSPDGLSTGDLLARAVETVRHTFSAPLKKVLKDFRDTNRVSFSIPEILKHTQEGRVSDLLICQEHVEPAAADQDLLNLAALQTLLHGGQAFALKPFEMPGESDAAALLRF
jgi:hypothetical protein